MKWSSSQLHRNILPCPRPPLRTFLLLSCSPSLCLHLSSAQKPALERPETTPPCVSKGLVAPVPSPPSAPQAQAGAPPRGRTPREVRTLPKHRCSPRTLLSRCAAPRAAAGTFSAPLPPQDAFPLPPLPACSSFPFPHQTHACQLPCTNPPVHPFPYFPSISAHKYRHLQSSKALNPHFPVAFSSRDPSPLAGVLHRATHSAKQTAGHCTCRNFPWAPAPRHKSLFPWKWGGQRGQPLKSAIDGPQRALLCLTILRYPHRHPIAPHPSTFRDKNHPTQPCKDLLAHKLCPSQPAERHKTASDSQNQGENGEQACGDLSPLTPCPAYLLTQGAPCFILPTVNQRRKIKASWKLKSTDELIPQTSLALGLTQCPNPLLQPE